VKEVKLKLPNPYKSMSYKQKKLERNPQSAEELEKIVEEEVRELVGPYAQLVKKLNILVDTKKPDTRNQIFKWLLENPETLKTLSQNVDKLINLVRI
jgi:arsenate reductase-like glutaredoxin family protein